MMLEDDVIDNFDNLTNSNAEALILAKKIGGRLGVIFVVLGYVCLGFLVFSIDSLGAMFCASFGAFIVALFTGNYFGGKIGQQVLVLEFPSLLRSILFALFILSTSGAFGGLFLLVIRINMIDLNNIIYDILGITAIALVLGLIPSLILGVLFCAILDSYKSRFNYIESEELST